LFVFFNVDVGKMVARSCAGLVVRTGSMEPIKFAKKHICNPLGFVNVAIIFPKCNPYFLRVVMYSNKFETREFEFLTKALLFNINSEIAD